MASLARAGDQPAVSVQAKSIWAVWSYPLWRPPPLFGRLRPLAEYARQVVRQSAPFLVMFRTGVLVGVRLALFWVG